eukprot:gene55010-66298_t
MTDLVQTVYIAAGGSTVERSLWLPLFALYLSLNARTACAAHGLLGRTPTCVERAHLRRGPRGV